MAYYTERHGMRRPATKIYDISIEKYALLFHCCEKYYNNLAWKYPAQCPDGQGCCGLDHATYCGFTGTPVDETIAVFGDVVDSYTMKESSDDGITVRIAYEPRLARVILSDEQAKEIQKYYDRCAEQGSTQEQIEESQRAMSQMRAILGHPDRLKKLAADIVLHYEALCAEKPEIVQKAMIVCSDRAVAFRLLKEILAVRPNWGEKHRAEDESELTEEQLDKLMPLPKINLVATQGAKSEN